MAARSTGTTCSARPHCIGSWRIFLQPASDQDEAAQGQCDIDGDGGGPGAEAVLRQDLDMIEAYAPPGPGCRVREIPDREAMPLQLSLPLHLAGAVESEHAWIDLDVFLGRGDLTEHQPAVAVQGLHHQFVPHVVAAVGVDEDCPQRRWGYEQRQGREDDPRREGPGPARPAGVWTCRTRSIGWPGLAPARWLARSADVFSRHLRSRSPSVYRPNH